MAYPLLKIIHIAGIAFLIMAIGGISLHTLANRTGARSPVHRYAAIMHGTSLFVLLASGTTMAVVLGYYERDPLGPVWLHFKFIIWLLLGAALPLLTRFPGSALPIWFSAPVLVGAAAVFALLKPF